MKISCCMIVKDEEKNIKRALTSISGKVDEIIVIDTGSTDKTTREIIAFMKHYGRENIIVNDFVWIDDFAAARNYSKRFATGDFIFFMDADEEFIGEMPELTKQAFYTITIQNHTDAGVPMTSVPVRFAPNIPEVSFKGRVHEQFASTIPLEVISINDCYLNHYGYLGEAREAKDKRTRNVTLLEAELTENPTPDLCYYLGQEYYGLGKFQEALELSDKGIALISEDKSYAATLYNLQVVCLIELGCRSELTAFADHYADEYEHPETYLALASYFASVADEGRMLRCAFNCLKFHNAGVLPVRYAESSIKLMPYKILGEYYESRDKLLSLYFYEYLLGAGCTEVELYTKLHSLLPKTYRTTPKWEYYATKCYELTNHPGYFKSIANAYLNTTDSEKHEEAMKMIDQVANPLERIQIRDNLESNGKQHLAVMLTRPMQYTIPTLASTKASISIIIPTMLKASADYFEYNLKLLEECPLVDEVIIINNSNEIFPYYCSKAIIYELGKNIGVNPAWNLGMQGAKGDYYLLLNDDCLINEQVLWDCVSAHKWIEDAGVIGCFTKHESLEQYISKTALYTQTTAIEYNFEEHKAFSLGWFIFGKTSDWVPIPEELVYFYGDDFIHHKQLVAGRTNLVITSNYISHAVSTTVNALDLYRKGLLQSEGTIYQRILEEENGNFIHSA